MTAARTRVLCAAVLVLVSLGPLGATLAGTRLYFFDDLGQFSYPLRQFYADSLGRGTLPLWCPYLLAGYPLVADGQVGPFYPVNLVLFGLLPTPLAFSWALGLGLLCAAWGMYLYLVYLTRSVVAGLGAAAALVFSGFWVGHVVHLNLIQAAAAVPWAFYCLERAWVDNRRWLVGVSAAVGMSALAGFPQATQILLAGLVARAVWIALTDPAYLSGIGRAAWVVATGASLVTGLALGAAQLLPTYELLSQGPRAGGLTRDAAAQVHLVPRLALTGLVPRYFGHAPPGQTGGDYWGGGGAGQWEFLCYAGAPMLALALAWIWPPWHNRHAVFFLILLVVSVLVAFGPATFLFDVLRYIPGFAYFRVYARFLMLAHLSVVCLAGMTVGALFLKYGRGRVAAGAALVAAGILLVVLTDPFGADRPAGTDPARLTDLSVLVPLVACAVLALGALVCPRTHAGTRALAVGVAVLACAESGAALWDFNRSTPTAVALADSPTAKWLKQEPLDGRVLVQSARGQDTSVPDMNRCLGFSVPATYRLPAVSGYAPLAPMRIRAVEYGVLGNRRGPAMPPARHANLLRLLRVQAVVATPGPDWPPYDLGKPSATFGDTAVYWLGEPGPEAFLAERVEVVPYPRSALAFIADGDVDLSRTACVEDALPECLTGDTPPGTVRITHTDHAELHLDIQADRPALAVIARRWDPGWKAWLDDRPVPILRTDYLLQGVSVPSGTHRLRLAYRPTSLWWGAAVSGGAALVLVLSGLVLGRRRRGDLW